MRLNNALLIKIYSCLLGLILIFISSCKDDESATLPAGSFVSFQLKGIKQQTRATHPGDNPSDYIIHTLRIIAFDKNTGVCKSNVYYSAVRDVIIHHPIKEGVYDFLFIANEPNSQSIQNYLNDLVFQGVTYSELKENLAFPSSYFASDKIIPMKDELDDIEVLSDGSGVSINGGAAQSIVPVNLRRIGVRLDVFLRAKENLDDSFKGVSLTHLSDKVPLYSSSYTGLVNRTEVRSFTTVDNSQYFSTPVITNEEIADGIVWARNVSRIVIPAVEFANAGNPDDAVEFTINLEGKYNPTAKLKIAANDYTLPQNTKLDLRGLVKMPLELNIQASKWDTIQADWSAENRLLNISQVTAKITDFNGVRISFWSNMPKVRVLPEVYVGSSSNTLNTNLVFNDLAITADNLTPTRFQYNPATGSGYMDILFDGGRTEGDRSLNSPGQRSYRIVLSAEDENGLNALRREIKVDVSQYGERPIFLPWGDLGGYIGAFFKNEEVGERIISGQHNVGREWVAEVVKGQDFIVLSSTPSFDPSVGTNNPDYAEKYLVVPNPQNNESKSKVTGKGRIYFRIGMADKHTDTSPRYGVVKLTYYAGDAGATWTQKDSIFVRQGESPDWVYGNTEVIREGILANQTRTAARKFATYNLTTEGIKNGSVTTSEQIGKRGAVFVDYPTQAGAFFQWASSRANFVRRAYHPVNNIPDSEANAEMIASGFWIPDYQDENEVSPMGFSRPSDGLETQKAYNGPYLASNVPGSPDPYGIYNNQIAGSEVRVSLFLKPEAGNGYKYLEEIPPGSGNWEGVRPTYPQSNPTEAGYSTALVGTKGGFYADGFFDRRPIDLSTNSVSKNNGNVAYKGILFYNLTNCASLFLPVSGRRTSNGKLESQGSTSYIWTSSVGPWLPHAIHPVWSFGMSYYVIGPLTQVSGFMQSIRCVEGE